VLFFQESDCGIEYPRQITLPDLSSSTFIPGESSTKELLRVAGACFVTSKGKSRTSHGLGPSKRCAP
jgi:hypothetical protein